LLPGGWFQDILANIPAVEHSGYQAATPLMSGAVPLLFMSCAKQITSRTDITLLDVNTGVSMGG